MSKYIDLVSIIHRDTQEASSSPIGSTLIWLDDHPGQVPGRTITQSDFDYAYELHKGVDGDAHYEGLLRNLGISIIPEPTEADKLETLIKGHINVGGTTPRSLAEYLTAHGVTV